MKPASAPCRLCFVLLATLLARAASAQPNYTAPYCFSSFAGIPGGPGDADGTGPEARFNQPESVAVDGNGNVFVADANNHTIRKISSTGGVTTLAGSAGLSGSADGSGSDARFNSPLGLAVDGLGNIVVADTFNQTIRRVTPAGVVTTLTGAVGIVGNVDGPVSAARFGYPASLAVDSAGNIHVVDFGSNTIRKISAAGVVSTVAGNAFAMAGYVDGTGSAARFTQPRGVAVDGPGNVYVADTFNKVIRKITPAGVVTTLATSGSTTFSNPIGLAIDSAGNLYVTNSIMIDKIAPGGSVTVLAGSSDYGGIDGTGPAARFNYPEGLAVDGTGNVYVADTRNQTIRKITAAGAVTTLAGSVGDYGDAVDATGPAARFRRPNAVALDGNGNVYVADTRNHMIRKITAAGVVTTLAGSPTAFGTADGTGSAARFNEPGDVATDGAGNVYVADTTNLTIRKITPAGVVTTLAGAAREFGSTDGPGSAARFSVPSGIAVDGGGNVFVADTGNRTIRKITSDGIVTTFAGSAGQLGSADGPGPAARFDLPHGLAVDATGNIFVADTANRTIRKITPNGLVSTLAGTPGLYGNDDGAGATARFEQPVDVAVDGSGNIFVADAGNASIRRITPAGVVTTVAGAKNHPGNQPGIGSSARFDFPSGLAVDQAGTLYVANTASHNITKGQLATLPVISAQPQGQAVTAGGSVTFSVTAAGVPAPTYQWNFNGSPFMGGTASTLSFTNARSTDAGDYTVVVTNSLGSVTSAKATLTVSAATTTPSPSSGSGGGGGGGGAPSGWFVLALSALTAVRRLSRADRT